MIKKISVFFCLMTMLLTGCSALDHDSQEELAASFIEAVADEDSEAVWEAFTPEAQSELTAIFGNDEDKAKEETLRALQEGLKRKTGLEDISDLPDNEELFQQMVTELLNSGKLVEIDGEWFINISANPAE